MISIKSMRNQVGFLAGFEGLRSKIIAAVNLFINTILIDYIRARRLAAPIMKRRTRVRVTFRGMRFVLRFPSPDFSALNETCHKGVYDEAEKPGGVIFDAGAHIGTFTVRHAMDPNNSVYSFEPEPANFKMLKENLRLNKLRNVKTFNCALSNHTGREILYVSELSTVNPSLCMKRKKGISVEVSTIDTVVKELKPDTVDFLKIDVEGAELALLRGATNTMKKFHPTIALETDDIASVMKFLRKQGYIRFILSKSYSNMSKPNIVFCKPGGQS